MLLKRGFALRTCNASDNTFELVILTTNFDGDRTKLYQRNGDVTMVCKAYNGRIVMQWLADTAAETVQQNLPGVDDRLAPIALCMFLVSVMVYAMHACMHACACVHASWI